MTTVEPNMSYPLAQNVTIHVDSANVLSYNGLKRGDLTVFSERLDYLMDITKVKNSVLAATINMDASHISRLRNGSRVPPKNQDYILPMSRFFAHNIKDEFQIKVLCSILQISQLPSDEESLTKLIYVWLTDKPDESVRAAEIFVNGFTSARRMRQSNAINEYEGKTYMPQECCFYGNAGKRDAVIRLLSAVLQAEKPCTLLLFSDEEMDWMTEDAMFIRKWAELLTAILRRGNRIKIIHTINRNSDEMMEAVTKWVPVYMTGMIEPYYYPKLRDGVFQRTLFIAPEIAAIVSESVSHDSSMMLNLYLEQKEAVSALVMEYERYLSLCKPLMKIYGSVMSERYFEDYIDFTSNISSSILLSPSPSLMTMPEKVAKAIAKRCNCPSFYTVWKKCSSFLEENLSVPFTEIITSIPDSQSDRINIPMADIFRTKELYYTKKEYSQHIEYISSLCEKHKNYSYFTVEQADSPVMIWGKEDVGILLACSDEPSTIFAFSEPNMTAAFWAYLCSKKKCIRN